MFHILSQPLWKYVSVIGKSREKVTIECLKFLYFSAYYFFKDEIWGKDEKNISQI